MKVAKTLLRDTTPDVLVRLSGALDTLESNEAWMVLMEAVVGDRIVVLEKELNAMIQQQMRPDDADTLFNYNNRVRELQILKKVRRWSMDTKEFVTQRLKEESDVG